MGFATLALAQNGDNLGEAQTPVPPDIKIPPAPPLSAEESLKTFHLPPGFRIELVAAEPLVESPVAMQFDPNGRMGGIVSRPQEKGTVSCAFAGPGRSWLYACSSDKVYRRKTLTAAAATIPSRKGVADSPEMTGSRMPSAM